MSSNNTNPTGLSAMSSGMGARKPLAGLQIMLVDDSCAVSHAIRLMALRAGARIRRADSIRSAEKHLRMFRPKVVIVDLDLPDGDGADLAARLSDLVSPAPAVLIISAADEATTEAAATSSGADGYLVKPVQSLAAFEAAVLGVLGSDTAPRLGLANESHRYRPDVSGTDDHVIDLENAQDLLAEALAERDQEATRFCARFVAGLAVTVEDEGLHEAAMDLAAAEEDADLSAERARALLGLLNDRLDKTGTAGLPGSAA